MLYDTILQGDALATLRTLPDACVQCVVTSPPYWGLRDYGVTGQLGLERTPDEYVARMVEIFREVRRVLRTDGTLWCNMGDCFNAYNGGAGLGSKLSGNQTKARPKLASGYGLRDKGLKPKDLLGMPWMLAFALRADGWYLRSDIIWHKPNPMPESVTDRPTKAHEYIFLLTKSERYHYDAAAIREPLKDKTFTTFGIPLRAQGNDALGKVKSDNWGRTVATHEPKVWKMPDGWDTGPGGHGSFHRQGREKGAGADKQRRHSRRHAGFNDRWDQKSKEEQQVLGANKRSVWTVATRGFPEAHFATFPPALIEPCILAGAPAGGLVLDPFMGAGTVGVVCRRHSRRYLGIELNPAYVAMAEKRIADEVQPVLWTA